MHGGEGSFQEEDTKLQLQIKKEKKIQYVNQGPVQLKDLELNDMETICKASWLPVYTSKFLIISCLFH